MFSTPEILAAEDVTQAAFSDPRPGDSFHEMFTFRMFVIAVEPEGRVAVMTVTPPCTLPRDGKVEIYPTHDAYRTAFAYGSIAGYWMRLGERGLDVSGWFGGWPEEPAIADCARCADLIRASVRPNSKARGAR